MVRKQVYIEAEQDDEIKRLAQQLGVTEAYVIRRGIELVKRDLKEPKTLDIEAGRRLLGKLRERASAGPRSDGGRTWTREDAYDERIAGLSDRH
jgi:hypothetical protein